MKHRGSKRHVLEWLDQRTFVTELNDLLKPLPVTISTTDRWVPKESATPKETTLEAFGRNNVPELADWTQVRSWWQAGSQQGKTPTWDLISTCTIATEDSGHRKGILLVEAKANAPELSRAGQRPPSMQEQGRIAPEAAE
jgi:hypothetical protein